MSAKDGFITYVSLHTRTAVHIESWKLLRNFHNPPCLSGY